MSFEQLGEQSLTINSTTDLMRCNGHGDVFTSAHIVEHYTDLMELMFCLRSKDQFNTIDCTSLPLFREAAITNLQVNKCVWQLDSRIQANWQILLCERLRVSESRYNNKIGYNKEIGCFVFRWRRHDTNSKNLCWGCGTQHESALNSPTTVWGLKNCYEFVK